MIHVICRFHEVKDLPSIRTRDASRVWLKYDSERG